MRHGKWSCLSGRWYRCRPGALAFVLLAFSVATHAAPPAAKLKWVSGVVLIGDGSRFIQAREGATLAAGERVMVTEGAQAMIVYADGCEVRVEENTLFSLGGADSCSSSTTAARRFGPHYAAAIGSIEKPTETDANPAESEAKKPDAPNEGKGSRLKELALPVAFTGAGIALFAVIGSGGGSSGSDDNPGLRTNLSPQ